MVGAEGFEPPTLCSQSRCATRLRYAPTDVPIVSRNGFPLAAVGGADVAWILVMDQPADLEQGQQQRNQVGCGARIHISVGASSYGGWLSPRRFWPGSPWKTRGEFSIAGQPFVDER